MVERGEYKEVFEVQKVNARQLTADLMAKASSEEIDALGTWKGSSYSNINSWLRRGESPGPYLKQETEQVKTILGRMETTEQMVLRRGTSIGLTDDIFGPGWRNDPQSFIGKTVADKGFMATTTDVRGGFQGKVMLYINAPKGTHGAYIQDIGIKNHEYEFLLNAGQQLIKKDIRPRQSEYGNTVYDIFVEVVK